MISNDALYFPQNYADSRQRFHQAVKAVEGNPETEQWPIPSQIESDLFVDLAYWPALKNSETLLVVSSGIHGSETYAGSAIQQMILQEIIPGMDRNDVGVLLVHCMNPYGFKHHQRTTEAGVNLNRNFSLSGRLFQTINWDSRQMHERFYCREKVRSLKSKLFEKMQMRDGTIYFDDVSMDQYTKAVSPGQFESSENLEFGGKKLEPQSEMLAKKLSQLMPQYHNIIAIDLHTGLGDTNRLHLLTSGSGAGLHPELSALIFKPKEDFDIYQHTPATTEGYYEVHGALNSLFVDLASPRHRVCAITAEFGTLGHSLEAQLAGMNAFIINHQGQFYGYEDEKMGEQARLENFLRSYPQNDTWRQAVVGSSRGLAQRILQRLKT